MYHERICPENSTQYVVKKGDTLWQISKVYGVSVQSILDANPGVGASSLQVGSILCIPFTSQSAQPQIEFPQTARCPEGSFAYTVKAGDTFWKLSQKFGVNLQHLIDANPNVPINNLQIGSTICIPTAVKPKPAPPITPTLPVTCPEGTFAYTVKAGDTFWKLSQIYGINVQSIIDANPGVDANNLQVGSTICIPSAAQTPVQPQVQGTRITKCPEGIFAYTVKAGDTFWKLSRIYGVSLQSLVDANPGVPANNLQVGSTICIPKTQEIQPEEVPPEPVLPEEALPEEAAPEEVLPEPVLPEPKPPAACPKGTFPYVVEAGDTLWQLSLNFGVSVQSILDVNPDITLSGLPAGTTICIPIAAEKPVLPETEDKFIYIVKECDSICSIARKFYVSVESIILKNPGINPRCLQPGTALLIPLNCCGSNTFRYVVSAGDTLHRIANKFNVCPSAIAAANPNIDFNHLVRCQVICIPSR